MIKIAPSILAADFSRLAEEVKAVEAAGADLIHIDVMDGHFVPNITMGPLVVEALKKVTDLPLDVHLMIANPHLYIESFAAAGADYITVHIEADPHIHRTLQEIKRLGAKAGVVLNPGTSVELISSIIQDVEMVLVMTVNPGFGGQSFIEHTVEKIAAINKLKQEKQLDFEIEVDGGINIDTIKRCYDAGADVFVAGSAIFGHADRNQAIADLRSQAMAGR